MEDKKAVGYIVNNSIRILVISLVAIMFISILCQVFFRYFLDNPLIWSEELARFCMIWVTFLGATVALYNNGLVSVDIVANKLPPKYREIIMFLNYIGMFIMCGFLLYTSVKLLYDPSVIMQKSPAMRIPMVYVYSCLPISFGVMLLQLTIKIKELVHKKGVIEE